MPAKRYKEGAVTPEECKTTATTTKTRPFVLFSQVVDLLFIVRLGPGSPLSHLQLACRGKLSYLVSPPSKTHFSGIVFPLPQQWLWCASHDTGDGPRARDE